MLEYFCKQEEFMLNCKDQLNYSISILVTVRQLKA